MSKTVWIVALAMLAAAPSVAQTGIPDLRGTWKGESESIVLGAEHPHHPATQSNAPELRSVPFTLIIDTQDGRRFSGTFSSARRTAQVIGVVSRSGQIFLADSESEGQSNGTLLAPNRLELCYLHASSATRIASCTELTKQQ
jgi:hypothetical protein